MLGGKKNFYFLFVLLVACSGGSGGPPGGMSMQVVAKEVRNEDITEKISLVGTVQANESVTLQSEVDGSVEVVNFVEGQVVAEGDVLIRLEQTKLKAAYSEAMARFKLASLELDRNKRLLKSRTISKQEMDQATSTFDAAEAEVSLKKRELEDSTISAPFAGVVGERLVSPGQRVSAGFDLSTIVSLNPLKVEFHAPERFLASIKAGQSVELSVSAYPQERFIGEVYFVAPVLDSDTRTVLLKAKVENSDLRLKPGMFANLDLSLGTRSAVTVVPEAALMLEQGAAKVFVVKGDNTVELRSVDVGYRLEGRAEIMSGVAAGEKVVTEGHQKLRPGAAVRLASQKAS